jgi:CelD/BcsL family acetyltransferase involved in cellulose biosynthesis
MREQVRRRMKTLEGQHAGRLILVENESQLADGMDALFRLHEARWRGRGAVGSFERHAHNKAFHRQVATEFLRAGWLRLYLLEADGQIVAALYGYEDHGRFSYYQAGFDPRWAKQSVGMVLMGSIIRDCIARGVSEFDFLRGDESYKYRWSRVERQTADAVVWNRTLRGRLNLAQARAVATIKRVPGIDKLSRLIGAANTDASL